jgi:predicted O-methyltransferase YrrM
VRVPGLYHLNVLAKPLRRRLRAAWLTRIGRREDAVEQLSRTVPGMFRHDEIRLLYKTARDAKGPGDLAEIGSWRGRTAVVQALGLVDSGASDARIYAIDHHQGSEEHQERVAREGSSLPHFRRNVQRVGVADRVVEMVMDSAHAAAELERRGVRLRMLFIDGAHDELSVRRDIKSFLPFVNPGGIIALHDCEPDGEWPGVWKAYQSELAPRVEEVARASSLLVTRLRR